MLDLGFEPDIREIAGAIPVNRQTVMFSATWPTSIQTMASRYLKEPVRVYVKNSEACNGSGDEEGPNTDNQQKASTRVHQIVQVVRDPFARDSILLKLLQEYHATRKNRVLVFVLYKKEADRIERLLKANRWQCVSIHGDKAQRDRTEALAAFKSGQVPLMIATDVAARGLDIPDVEYVINFTFPLTIEDYIHRIGRTGRGGASGTAHTLFTDADKPHSGELINVLKASKNSAEIPQELYNYGTTTKKKIHKEYGAFYKDVDPSIKASHMKFDD
jgi:ATP-dependent RNA helicase DBP3